MSRIELTNGKNLGRGHTCILEMPPGSVLRVRTYRSSKTSEGIVFLF
jgi:hypothetical protein